jgi:hypothetical protein
VSNLAVFFHRVGEDQDVVEIDGNDAFSDQVLEDLVHHGLEGGRTIGEAKLHDQWFK